MMQGTVRAAPGDGVLARPGELVSANGVRLSLYCTGSGSPTVAFDAGHQDWAPAWAVVQPQIAKWTRACSYDRTGAGFSDAGSMPRTSARIADELHGVLHKAAIPGPYILVGHAFGGYNTRAFAHRYMPEVAGLVLIDTDSGDADPHDLQQANHSYFVVQGSELRACRDAVAGGKPLAAVLPPAGQSRLTCEQRFFRGFPEKAWSPELNARLLQIAQTRLARYEEVVSELAEMPGDEVDLQQHRQSFGSRPIRVLTAVNVYGDTETTARAVHLRRLKLEEERAQSQARFLELSTNAKQSFAYHSGSGYIQLDQPDLVIAALREAYDEGRSRGSNRPQDREGPGIPEGET
jgi:pimeloyl-ACP methyl ester carboxylesterase